MEIKKVENNNSDFSKLCKKLDDIHNEIVAEQRSLGANCCVNNEKLLMYTLCMTAIIPLDV